MTLTANVKWYINWEEWGVIDNTILLKEISELKTMLNDDVVSELNSHPEEYYNKFLASWNLKQNYDWYHWISENNSYILLWSDRPAYFWYSNPKPSWWPYIWQPQTQNPDAP